MKNMRAIVWISFAILLVFSAHLVLDIRGARLHRIVMRGTVARSADAASAVTIKRKGEPTIVISKASGEWRLVSPFNASADSYAVLELIDALAFSPILDSMDDAELRKLDRSRNDFGLQTPSVEVETIGSGGTEKILFGSQTPASDGFYAAVEGEGVVFVVATNVFAAVDKSADAFRRRALFNMSLDEVGGFDIRLTAGAFSRFMRDGEKWSMMESQPVAASASRISKFLSLVLEAKAKKFVWPVGASNEMGTASASMLAGYGLDPDSAITLTLKGVDGLDRQVSFGSDAEDGTVYAMAHNGGTIVTVDASLRDMMRSGSDDFVDTRLFPVEASAVATISISDGDMKCVLSKGLDGTWRIDAPVSAPADSAVVSELVSRLLALQVSDVDASGVSVSLDTGMRPVMVSRGIVFAESGVERFRAREVIDVVPAEVKRVVVSVNGENPVSVVYDPARSAWNVEASNTGGVVDTDALESLLATLHPLKAQAVVKLGTAAEELYRYGLESPSFTIAIDRSQTDLIRKNLRIGGRTDSGYYATIGSADAVFLLSEDIVRKLMAPIVQ